MSRCHRRHYAPAPPKPKLRSRAATEREFLQLVSTKAALERVRWNKAYQDAEGLRDYNGREMAELCLYGLPPMPKEPKALFAVLWDDFGCADDTNPKYSTPEEPLDQRGELLDAVREWAMPQPQEAA